ncbi:YegP family protein [Hellea sp.]|nr:YegP family protein [Hellea sp.]
MIKKTNGVGRLISAGNIMADSGQGYASKQGCMDAIMRVKELMKTVEEFEVKK